MTIHGPRTWAAWVVVGGAFLLLIDLFLDWQRASVQVDGVIDVRTSATGWASLGIAAGVLAICVIAATLTRHLLWALGLAGAMLTATAFAAFLGSADVSTPALQVVVDTTLWPAWVGLVLAAATAAGTLVPFLPWLAEPGGLRPHHAA